MSKDVDEVRVGVDGVVAVGDFGAEAPTSAISVLAEHTDYGYVSEDGVTESTSITSEKIKAWQKAKVVRVSITEATVSWKLVLIQTSAETVALYHGGVVLSDGSIIVDPTKQRPVLSFVIDVIDGEEIIRSYAPEAQVTEVGDLVYQNGAPIGYEVTIEASYNETLGGSVKKWYSSLAAAPVPVITTALPASKTTSDIIALVGTGFEGTTAITVGGVNAPTFDVDSDTKIYLTIPAGSAGSAPIIVTTPGGPSVAKAYTRT